MKEVTAELKRLYDMGFAIHWLRPRSKIPVKKGWTTGPRFTWKELNAQFKPGYNPGVRLGEPSKLSNGYLAIIDVDIKSEKEKHKLEVEKELNRLFPEVKTAPVVLSGRGNGSAHYYIATKTPNNPDELKARSKNTVKVKIPSVPPNTKEKSQLTADELKQGIRLRPAWEISLMSTGRQAAIAGAIHPDTGNKYTWGKPLEGAVPVVKPPAGSGTNPPLKDAPTSPKTRSEWNLEDLDAEDFNLPGDQIQALVSGTGVEDRSNKIYALCMSWVQRGLTDEQILSLLTRSDYYLGRTGFDHARTANRQRAARWVEKYCLSKAKNRVDDTYFDIEEITPTEKKSKQERFYLTPMGCEKYGVGSWCDQLELKHIAKGKPPLIRNTYLNLRLILGNTCSNGAFVKRDVFAGRDTYTCDTPWGMKKGDERSAGQEDALIAKEWLCDTFGMDPPLNAIDEVINTIAVQHTFHPVKEYLESLQWDGVERVENAFEYYLGAKMPQPYLKDVSRKFFLACVKRIYEPGCKHDDVVILEGFQGIGKSTFPETLASSKWFLEGLPDLRDKDAALNLQGAWLCEFGELMQVNKAALDVAKTFVARSVDRVRPPYGVRRVNYPRSTVFIGTTDKYDYLTDSAGNRRWLPVRVRQCKFDELKKDRDQLWAEAVNLYFFCNEPLYLTGAAKEQAKNVQETRRVEDEGDSMRTRFLNWINEQIAEKNSISEFTIADLFENGPFSTFPATKSNTMRAGEVLRVAGYSKHHTSKGNVWRVARHTKN